MLKDLNNLDGIFCLESEVQEISDNIGKDYSSYLVFSTDHGRSGQYWVYGFTSAYPRVDDVAYGPFAYPS